MTNNVLSDRGERIKQEVAAVAEMEQRIFDFLAQQHPDFLEDAVICNAISSVHYKLSNRFFRIL